MTEKNNPATEIVPFDHARELHSNEARELKRVLTHLVEEKVAEAMGPTAIFQPFFQTPLIMQEIRRLQSVPEQRKFARYFQKWGCLAGCGATADASAQGNLGMCVTCYRRISSRLFEIVREHTPTSPENQSFTDAVDLARSALVPTNKERRDGRPAELQQAEKGRRLYDQREAAAAAGIDPATLRRWLRDGDVRRPSVKVTDKRFLWTDADVELLKILKSKNASLHSSKASLARWNKKKNESV